MADTSKLKKLLQKRAEKERKIERLKKKKADWDVERQQFIEKCATTDTSKQETRISRLNQGFLKRLNNLNAELQQEEDELSFINQSIIEEAEKVKEQVRDELERESLEKQAHYETENEFILNQKNELNKRIEGLSSYHKEASKARDQVHTFTKYYDPMKIALIVETPDILKSQLNSVLALMTCIRDESSLTHCGRDMATG
jgi:chromosome segregation ATPase